MKGFGKIHKAAGSDKVSVISNVLVERTGDGQGIAVATDGYIFAIRRVELGELDVPGLVPGDAFKSPGRKEPEIALAWKTATVRSGSWSYSKVFAREDGKFPDRDAILGKARAAIKERGSVQVMLNPKYIMRLWEALSTDTAKLSGKGLLFEIPLPPKGKKSNLEPVLVTGPAGEGIIMPIHIKN